MRATFSAKFDRIMRPILTRLPFPKLVTNIYSGGRNDFMRSFRFESPDSYEPSKELERELWGIKFRSPIMNAAGMFKGGECYDLAFRQGAGAYLAGTTTFYAREGNSKIGIFLPFVPYPDSRAASNWLGLPNPGHYYVAEEFKHFERREGFPIGASVAADPGVQEEEALERLVDGMRAYEEARFDFIEMNESCPNTSVMVGEDNILSIKRRLRYVKENFLERRLERTPVIVKFSVDTLEGDVPVLIDMLLENCYDGINFGNTSTAYDFRGVSIRPHERPLYEFFVENFGGGVSGRPLKGDSLRLVYVANNYLNSLRSESAPNRYLESLSEERGGRYTTISEPLTGFHVIRTGGIEDAMDLKISEEVGVSLNQWFTGYFEAFSRCGHDVYRGLYESFLELSGSKSESRSRTPNPS